jgi:hypothetical protein
MKYLYTVLMSSALLLSGQSMANINTDVDAARMCNEYESIVRDGATMRQNNHSFDETLDYLATTYDLYDEGLTTIETLLAVIYTMPIMPAESKEMLVSMLANTALQGCLNGLSEDSNEDVYE